MQSWPLALELLWPLAFDGVPAELVLALLPPPVPTTTPLPGVPLPPLPSKLPKLRPLDDPLDEPQGKGTRMPKQRLPLALELLWPLAFDGVPAVLVLALLPPPAPRIPPIPSAPATDDPRPRLKQAAAANTAEMAPRR
jgi:hypothetical protein